MEQQTCHAQSLRLDVRRRSGLSIAANKLVYGSGTNSFSTTDFTAWARTLLDDADASTALSTLGVSAFTKTLLDDADAAAARGTLSLGNAATKDTGTGSGARAGHRRQPCPRS